MPFGISGLRKLSGSSDVAIAVNKLVEAVQSVRLLSGVGYRVDSSSSGTRIRIRPNATAGTAQEAATGYHPFEVVAGYSDDPTAPLVRVVGWSWVFSTPWQAMALQGLGARPGSFADNASDPGQFPLPGVGQAIWLHIPVNTDFSLGDPATIEHGNPWPGYPTPWELYTETQYAGRQKNILVPIAEVSTANDDRDGTVYTVGTESRKLVQLLKTNVILRAVAFNGEARRIAEPWHGFPEFSQP
jgi:hypothetical protein